MALSSIINKLKSFGVAESNLGAVKSPSAHRKQGCRFLLNPSEVVPRSINHRNRMRVYVENRFLVAILHSGNLLVPQMKLQRGCENDAMSTGPGNLINERNRLLHISWLENVVMGVRTVVLPAMVEWRVSKNELHLPFYSGSGQHSICIQKLCEGHIVHAYVLSHVLGEEFPCFMTFALLPSHTGCGLQLLLFRLRCRLYAMPLGS